MMQNKKILSIIIILTLLLITATAIIVLNEPQTHKKMLFEKIIFTK